MFFVKIINRLVHPYFCNIHRITALIFFWIFF
nr:MAG TPA: hypothetical protein [Caudoviricetes sp.]DAM78542.1 MAG TPA: hypothetical protein [Caudoviricetes sp.]DAP03203.1 MAG TPA: hypothetical protein [Caudoviricetes sp.]DAT97960.1 MAG TPA: hypothetical protein [Caudoviricetes sp.]